MRHKEATFNDAVAALDILNGVYGVRAVNKGRPFEAAKYGDEPLGRYEALRNKLGDDITDKLLADEVRLVSRDGQTLVVEAVPIRLFDKNGRRVLPRELKASVIQPNRSYYLTAPNNDHLQIICRLQHAFEMDDGWPSVGEFQDKVGVIEERLRSNELTADALNGFGFDFCVPMTPTGDLGDILDKRFIAALGRAYTTQVGRPFNNCRHKDLKKKVSIVSCSRHDQLVKRASNGYVIGKLFVCLQGYSVRADREQMQTLPNNVFLLNGGYDTASCIAAHADNFGRDFHTLGIDWAALQWRSSKYSLYFGASDVNAHLNNWDYLGCEFGNYSAALVALG